MLGSSSVLRTMRRLKYCCNNSSLLLLAAKDRLTVPKDLPLCRNINTTTLTQSRFCFGERQSSIHRRHLRSLNTQTDAHLAIELALDSVVKIFTVSSSPNYFLPWQNKSQRETMGSGKNPQKK